MKAVRVIAVILAIIVFLSFFDLSHLGGVNLDFKFIKDTIISDIQHRGLAGSMTHYFSGAYQEEMIFRGPILLLLLFLYQASDKTKEFLAWMLVIPLSSFWAEGHNGYPVFYQAIIFIAGLINGACIIYAKNKAMGMMAAILLHGIANILIILSIYFFFA